MYVHVGETVLKMFRLWKHILELHSIANLMYRELFRRVNLYGISQGLEFSSIDPVLMPVATLTRWEYNLSQNNFSLPHSPQTPGWRAMTSKDIPSALALTNKYTSQFEIRQVFQSEEEFSHYLMCPVIENYMQAYVVEDPVTGDITDVAGFELKKALDGCILQASVTIIVPAKSPAREMLIDLLVCAKQVKADIFLTFQYGLTNDVFENLTVHHSVYHCHLLNYQYYEVDESQVCLFCL